MFREVVTPQLLIKPNFDELFFHQDGAPPHYALRVRDYLNEVFPQHWFRRRGSIEWPPHSPDLTPMDFFFWGVVKNKVYEKNPKTINELKDYIHDALREIDEDRNLCRTVCQSGLDRCEECCNVGGGHFKHLRDQLVSQAYGKDVFSFSKKAENLSKPEDFSISIFDKNF